MVKNCSQLLYALQLFFLIHPPTSPFDLFHILNFTLKLSLLNFLFYERSEYFRIKFKNVALTNPFFYLWLVELVILAYEESVVFVFRNIELGKLSRLDHITACLRRKLGVDNAYNRKSRDYIYRDFSWQLSKQIRPLNAFHLSCLLPSTIHLFIVIHVQYNILLTIHSLIYNIISYSYRK